MMGDRVAESADCDLPFRLRGVDVVGQRQRTPNAVVDARAAGQQRLLGWTGRPSGPSYFTGRELEFENEVDGLGHHGPHRLREPPVIGDEDMVPDTGGDIGAEVAVAVGILDDPVAQLNRPGAVRPLRPA